MKEQKCVIVIGRQTGCGARRLGRELAQQLGFAYYDKELLQEAALRRGVRTEILEKADEKRPSPLRSLLSASLGSPNWLTAGTSAEEDAYGVQSRVIEELIREESCVIVGRTADYVARNHPGLASIFLHAPLGWRTRVCAEREGGNSSDARVRENVIRADARRRDYYNYFTGRCWGDAANYHLSLDTSLLTPPQILQIITDYLKARQLTTK